MLPLGSSNAAGDVETIVVAAAEDTAAVEEDIAVVDMTMEGADTVADIPAAAGYPPLPPGYGDRGGGRGYDDYSGRGGGGGDYNDGGERVAAMCRDVAVGTTYREAGRSNDENDCKAQREG